MNELTDKELLLSLLLTNILALVVALVLGLFLFDSFAEFRNIFDWTDKEFSPSVLPPE